MSDLLTPTQAARVAGVSYPTIKQWIYKGKDPHNQNCPADITVSPAVKSSV